MARMVSYNGNVYEVGEDNATLQDIKASMAEIFPELANAEAIEDQNGNITFKVNAGTKGARMINYAGNVYSVDDDNYTPEEIQKSMAEIFPELANASYTEDAEGNLTFTVQAGTKGDA